MKIGPIEIVIVLVIVILVFGIGKLPELGKSLGQGLRSFKSAQDEITQEVKTATSAIDSNQTTEKPVQSDAQAEAPTQPPQKLSAQNNNDEE